ncbi:L-carnitine CoA-transferase [Campylobacter sp. 19-13652]|uniref:L-carnitine CoA-transferase n=1 Tax=Campylobacter sp. 19-13652 TaxID=2840180 RepID=UPI001C770898|nr:L-carnitine CoA-transferase [Campylobacter sp. 19-13652]BCX80149.1 L-carnitine CoA-transferase [Campylobacter sp. 19-13652]
MGLDTPKFGVLAGVRVVFSAMEVAAPFAAGLMAEWGAEVIWIENPKYPDTIRVQEYYSELARRNMYSLCLDVFSELGREVFLNLIKTADVFIESSKGPAFAKKGLSDELLWQANKKLVIAHLSGFGHSGDERFVRLAAYNTIAQAFSGYLIQNGDVNQPMPAFPYTADYMCGYALLSATLAALYKARASGEGESIDVAMYEIMLRAGQYYMMNYLNGEEMCPRMIKGKDPLYAGCGLYACKDGYIVFEVVGIAQVAAMFELIGLAELYASEVAKDAQLISRNMSVSERFEAGLDSYFGSLCVSEALDILASLKIAAAKVLEVSELESNPHYKARQSFISWQNAKGEIVKGTNVFPKFKNSPSRIWRPRPSYGQDTAVLLASLGYDVAQIADLQSQKTIRLSEK